MPQTLIRQIYVSCSCIAMNDLQELLETSERRNATCNITSALLCTDQYFMQVIEGPRQMVDDLMARVKHDPRHHSIQVILQESISERKFAQWPMGMASLPHMDQILQPLFTTKDGERAKILGAVLLQALKRVSYDH